MTFPSRAFWSLPFRDFRTLELGELVKNAVRELALRGVVTPIVKGADLRPVLLELAT
jgi:hypothetical protein